MRTKACVHTLAGHTNTVADIVTQAANPQVSACARVGASVDGVGVWVFYVPECTEYISVNVFVE